MRPALLWTIDLDASGEGNAADEVDPKDPTKGEVMLRDPAIVARMAGQKHLPLGSHVRLRLVEADPETRSILFEPAGD